MCVLTRCRQHRTEMCGRRKTALPHSRDRLQVTLLVNCVTYYEGTWVGYFVSVSPKSDDCCSVFSLGANHYMACIHMNTKETPFYCKHLTCCKNVYFLRLCRFQTHWWSVNIHLILLSCSDEIGKQRLRSWTWATLVPWELRSDYCVLLNHGALKACEKLDKMIMRP